MLIVSKDCYPGLHCRYCIMRKNFLFIYSLAALWIILSELIRRLKSYWSNPNRRDGEELILGVASSLPTHELFFEIDAHFMRRKKHRELEVSLDLGNMKYGRSNEDQVVIIILRYFLGKGTTSTDNCAWETRRFIIQLLSSLFMAEDLICVNSVVLSLFY